MISNIIHSFGPQVRRESAANRIRTSIGIGILEEVRAQMESYVSVIGGKATDFIPLISQIEDGMFLV